MKLTKWIQDLLDSADAPLPDHWQDKVTSIVQRGQDAYRLLGYALFALSGTPRSMLKLYSLKHGGAATDKKGTMVEPDSRYTVQRVPAGEAAKLLGGSQSIGSRVVQCAAADVLGLLAWEDGVSWHDQYEKLDKMKEATPGAKQPRASKAKPSPVTKIELVPAVQRAETAEDTVTETRIARLSTAVISDSKLSVRLSSLAELVQSFGDLVAPPERAALADAARTILSAAERFAASEPVAVATEDTGETDETGDNAERTGTDG